LSSAAAAQRVPDDHLSAPSQACTICGSREPRRSILVLQRDPEVALLDCGVCRAQSASRLPDEAFLKQLYAPSEYSSDLLSTRLAIRNTARHIVRHAPIPHAQGPLRVLDYGGGDGSLSRAFREALIEAGCDREIELTVVDHFVDERADPEIRFLDPTDFAALTERFDVVLASAVLEHLVDLAWTSRKLLSLCRPGAAFYARTPFEAPLATIVPGYAIRWPRHLHDLGPAFWSRFLETMGFEGRLLRSAPSVVESDFETRPLRTLAAHLMKLPARTESALFPARVGREGRIFWRWVGGWEVVLRVDEPLR
jgi:hypothetical protein